MRLVILAGAISCAMLQDDAGLAESIRQFRGGEAGSLEAVVARGESAVPALLGLLADARERSVTRFMAANALGEIAAPESFDGLLAALADPDFNVRRCSSLAIAWLGDARAKPALEKLAAEDPFAWTDPASGERHFLVRDDAREALAILSRGDVQLDDATTLPELRLGCEVRRLPWPFPGTFREQNLFNNYQQPTDSYLHAGLDLLHEKGSEVRAVDDGWVRLIETNYPQWKTHHYFVITPTEDGDQGFVYVHVDPDSYRFSRGDRVRKGQVLGKLVDFSVGANDGVDHLHLDYVELVPGADGQLELVDLADPLLFFDAPDEVPPRIEETLRFVRDGSLAEFARDDAGVASVSGRVDVIAGLSDRGWVGQSCNWGVPVVTLEIRAEHAQPWRKLVCDLRGPVGDERASGSLFVRSKDSSGWGASHGVHWMVLTNTDGDGRIQRDDRRYCWNTRSRTASGAARFPDGEYEVIVRAWDLAGGPAERSCKVRVRNER
jgi:murein DD-endopeptidase MepM/ murein hydrolase activator NlpD